MISAKLFLILLLQSSMPIDTDAQEYNIDVDETYCLAKNIYYEAKSESISGQYAVASVTLNRVNSPNFPKTICEVVKQTASKNKNICAFSWYCDIDKKGKEISFYDSKGRLIPEVVEQFRIASLIAIDIMENSIKDNTYGATHFHNINVSPAWKYELRKTVKIGNHIFYKP